MAVCNLFKELTKATGEFLLFSQYTDDLAHMSSSPGLWRAVPSHFLAMDLASPSEEDLDPCCYPAQPADILRVISNLEGKPIEIGDLIVSNPYSRTVPAVADIPTTYADPTSLQALLPLRLMRGFENGCAVLRDDQEGWNPNIARNLFWNMLFEEGWLTAVTDGENTASYVPQIKWEGTIDIQSFRRTSGMGYNESYCWIPPDAIESRFQVSRLGVSAQVICQEQWLRGWSEADQAETDIDLSLGGQEIYLPDRQWVFSFEADTEDQGLVTLPVEGSKSFSFNSILVLYNIECLQADGSIEILYEDIPMGLWWGGEQVPIIKYTSSEDIYGQGTSYGLRVLSRHTPTPSNDTIQVVSVPVGDGEDLADYSTVMSGFSRLTVQMQETLEEIYKLHQVPKEMLAIFKNSRVNVPYIKEVDGVSYWFVNGRCLGVPATAGGGAQITAIPDETIVQAWEAR